MKIKPLRDILLIEADKPKNQTESGIFISEDWKSLPQDGTVIDIGPEVTGVEIGQRVKFNRYGAVTVKDELKLCELCHIQAVIIDG